MIGFDRHRGKHLAIAGLIVLLNLAAYANTFKAAWHFDDYVNILENYTVHITALGELGAVRNISGGFSRIVCFWSFAWDYYFHGFDVTGFHVTNLAIHIAAAVLVFFITVMTITLPRFRPIPYSRTVMIAGSAALLWSLSPVHTSAVTYIVQRHASLAAMLGLLSFFFYVKGRRCMLGDRLRIGYVFLGCAAVSLLGSVLTKENTVMLPAAYIAYEFLFISKMSRNTLKKAAWMAGVFALFILLVCAATPNARKVFTGLSDLYRVREFTMYERVLTQFRVVTEYLSLIIAPLPSRLNLDHNVVISRTLFDPITTLLSVVFITGLMFAAAAFRRKDPLVCFGLLWFFITNAVESTIIPLELMFEHRIYLPSVGITIVLAVLVFRLFDHTAGLPETSHAE